MKITNIDSINKDMLKGKIISFPTDTVYGVGALIYDIDAIDKIYYLKERDFSKPLAILAPNIESILPYIKEPSKKALEIMNKYWPGALTIVFEKSALVDKKITRGLDTIGFRIPNSKTALKILEKTGPLATTSVNISGMMPLNDYESIDMTFGDKIDYLVCEKTKSSNVSSTVIDLSKGDIKVLRMGEIKVE